MDEEGGTAGNGRETGMYIWASGLFGIMGMLGDGSGHPAEAATLTVEVGNEDEGLMRFIGTFLC
jgi:hypothetical protein